MEKENNLINFKILQHLPRQIEENNMEFQLRLYPRRIRSQDSNMKYR
jgi:hypothetical protein